MLLRRYHDKTDIEVNVEVVKVEIKKGNKPHVAASKKKVGAIDVESK